MSANKLETLRNAHRKQISITSTIERRVEQEDVRQASSSYSMSVGGVNNGTFESSFRLSDSPLDPLNWSKCKTEFAFFSLLLLTSTIGILKSLLAPVNAVISSDLNCSFMAAAALTGIPFLLGAGTALGSSIAANKIGKRSSLIVGAGMMFVGSMWNMYVQNVYAEFMCARCFQGVGWGIVEGVLGKAIGDLFLSSKQGLRISVYRTVQIFFTWATPILGGFISNSSMGWRHLFMVTSIIQGISLLFLILLTPETTFLHSVKIDATLPPGSTILSQGTTITTIEAGSVTPFKSYLLSLRLTTPHSTSDPTSSENLLSLKALITPITILTTFLTAPLLASAYGVSHILSLLLSSAPVFLRPERLGYLFILPAWISFLFYGILGFTSHKFAKRAAVPSRPNTVFSLLITIPALLLGLGCTLGFGFYVIHELTPKLTSIEKNGDVAIYIVESEVMSEGCLWVVGALFGGLVGASTAVSFQGEKNISFALTERQGDGVITTAAHVWQQAFIGVVVLVMPLWVQQSGAGTQGMLMGLRKTSIGLGIVVFISGVCSAVLLFVKGDFVKTIDSRVLGIELNERRWAKDNDSFFDA